MTDRLAWWEEIPLGLALVAQSYVVGLWYFASIKGAGQWADLAVAIGAGLALDLVVITTVMGRRQGRSSGWSWATSLGAFLCSSLIALDRYGWEWRSGLHIAFPLVVFLYSQHLAEPKRQRSEGAQERSGATIEAEPPSTAADSLSAHPSASDDQALAAPLGGDRSAVMPLDRYPCPHCGAALASGRAVGAAKTNGYCQYCKAERKAG